MPSRSLVSSWTTSFVPSGTRFPHKAYPRKSSSSPRLRVLKRLHGLWKGTSSPRKAQLASGPTVRRGVSSTISMGGVTLVSRPPPTPFPFVLTPPSPTSPTPAACLISRADTYPNAIEFSEVEPGSVRWRPFTKSVSTAKPSLDSSSCVVSLHDRSPRLLPCLASTTSLAAVCGSGSTTLDAATRLRDFRALIDEMRATLLHRDSREDFDAGTDDSGEERERLLRLLEDVVRKVKRLAEKDAVGLGHSRSVTMTDVSP